MSSDKDVCIQQRQTMQELTHWSFQVYWAQVAFEKQSILQAVISAPGSHAVVSGHSAHGMLPGLVPPIGGEVQHLLQRLLQRLISL